MNLKVPIAIVDELAEVTISSTGLLDLASGEIHDVRYAVDRPGPLGLPASDEQYEFTSGVLSNDGKEVEFRVDVDVMSGRYFVNPSELLELKVRAAKLFDAFDLVSLDDPVKTRAVQPQQIRRRLFVAAGAFERGVDERKFQLFKNVFLHRIEIGRRQPADDEA